MVELEPAFSGLRSVCRELRLKGSGIEKYVDNLLINPAGRICLVECKLWRNPEAVREVVAQVLDYAAELSLLSYDDLSAIARRTLGVDSGDPVSERVLGSDAHEEDRASFIDNVTRSLSRGDFLLLVVGDGIRAGLQQIAGLLQNRATLGFSFGLVAPDGQRGSVLDFGGVLGTKESESGLKFCNWTVGAIRLDAP